MKGDNETLAQIASGVISCTYPKMDLYVPYADDFLDVYLQGNSDTRSMLGSKLRIRHFTAGWQFLLFRPENFISTVDIIRTRHRQNIRPVRDPLTFRILIRLGSA